MKKAIGTLIATTMLLAALWITGGMGQVVNKIVAYRNTSTPFTALQTFSGGVKTPFTVKKDYTIPAPTVAMTAAQAGTGSGCASGDTYRYYYAYLNPSGATMLSPASNDVTPSPSRNVTVTRSDTPPATTTAWKAYWSKLSQGHGTVRACNLGSGVVVDIATTTFDCGCSGSGTVYNNVNTTGPKTLMSGDDAILKFGRFDVSLQEAVTEDKNWLVTSGAQPFWSNDLGVNLAPVPILGKRVKYVCPVGCYYSTIAAALTDITDAAAGNRYLIAVSNYDSSEIVAAMKSYVTLAGTAPEQARVLSIKVPADVTEAYIKNMWMTSTTGSPAPMELLAGATVRTTLYVDNCIFGTPGAAPTADGIFDDGSMHDVILRDNAYYSTWDVIVFGEDSTYHGYNQHFVYANSNNQNPVGLNFNQGGAWGTEVYEFNPDFDVTLVGTSSTFDGIELRENGTPTGPTLAKVYGGSMRVKLTASSGTPTARCVWLTNGATSSSSLSGVYIYGMDCNIEAGSVGTLEGMRVDADADHINWNARWVGGSINLVGGSSRTDIVQNETAAGFTMELKGVLHSGAYAGAGNVTNHDQQVKCVNIDPAATTTDWLMWRTDQAISVRHVRCIVDAATSVVMTLRECNGDGASCGATEAAITCATTTTSEAGGIDDAAVAANVWMRVLRGTVTGSPTQASLCMEYTVP